MDKIPVDIIDAALYWAELGVPVFPCGTSKAPLTPNGFYDAEVDPAKVKSLFEGYPNASLIGGRMGGGLFVVDVDLYKGKEVVEWYDARRADGSLVDTRTHHTMSGGVHLFYKGNAGCPKPAIGVEIKGEGGYVILADGVSYTVENEGVVEAPPKLIELVESSTVRAKGSTIAQLKTNVLNGSDFHNSLAQIAAKLASSGLDQVGIQSELLDLMKASTASVGASERHLRWQNIISDKGGELSRIVSSAYVKFNDDSVVDEMTEAMGSMMDLYVGTADNVFTQLGDTDLEPEKAPVFDDDTWPFEGQGYFADEEIDLTDQNFVMFPIFAENETAVLFAEPKTGKTALALTTALHISCGLDLGSFKVTDAGPCLYYALEGSRAIRLRIESWKKEIIATGVTLPDRIPMFTIEKIMNFSKEEAREVAANQIISANNYSIKFGSPLKAIYIDTLTKAMSGSDQNSVEDTSALFDIVGRLREGGVTATVIFVHHKSRQGNVRGSSNIEAEPDILLDVSKKNDIISMKIARARSIEDGANFSFIITGVDLGKTKQGHALSGMFVAPLTSDNIDHEDQVDVQRIAQMRQAITQLGESGYTPAVDVIALWLKLGLIEGKKVRGELLAPSPQSAPVQEYLHKVANDAGGTIYGDYIIRPTTEGNMVVGFKVGAVAF